MNYKSITIISIIVTAIFVMPLFSFAWPGRPFQVLQNQIDDLQQQINDIQTGSVKAYTNSSHLNLFPQDEERDIITLSLPEGEFIMTIVMGATFFHGGLYDADYHTYLHCDFVDEEGEKVTGYGFGGGVVGHESLASNIPLTLFEATDITLRCSHNCGYDDPTPNDPMSFSIVWTAIEVDEMDNQIIIP